jgi:cytochrome bd ubiquinol oxidase subunit II
MTFDLTLVWAAIIAFGVFMYVLLDGFDLGIGILFPFAPDDAARNTMIDTVAPVWDGNETWLVLGGAGLFAAFPLAYAIILPALYFPILVMLVALIFRGVAFEFRAKADTSRYLWDRSFHWGSLLATFAQGVVLGAFIGGFEVEGRNYVGGLFGWLTPFSVMTGLGLIAGYGLLGATWLVLKTEGALQDWAYGRARLLLILTLGFIAIVSLWTPLFDADIAARWFSWPNIAWLSPVPILTAVLAFGLWRGLRTRAEVSPFIFAICLFLLSYAGLAISLWPYVIPRVVTIWDAAAAPESQIFLLVGAAFILPATLAYTAYSYWVFRGKVREGQGYH